MLLDYIPDVDCITKHDLYESYPDFFIQVKKEQELLVDHDLILFQHPLYWYSSPPLLKQWIDLVLELGWAYGEGGRALEGKIWKQIITTGGSETAYTPEGFHKAYLHDFLLPFKRTAELCRMVYEPPFVLYGSYQKGEKELHETGQALASHLQQIIEEGSYGKS
ncbi:flavodoxin-like protein [Leptospira ryugenii]|uniref:Flavodoxin-like protein n=2 Tax=Leptospira ryugenii TaxID=1917863 RepID=A0A2P2DVR7_9LEPT|nr:flavodoxin-like protein [Leptospira ryugenii]